MRYLIKLSAVFIAIYILLSCTKASENYTTETKNGVIYHLNSGEATGHYRPSARFLFEITGPENAPDSMKGFGTILDVIADFNDNIYVLDGEHAVIKKYNRDGKFERYFPEQSGNGIEHFMTPTQFALIYDTLLVYDAGNSKFVQYLTNGSFVQSHLMISGIKPIVLNSDGKTNLSSFVPAIEEVDSVQYSVNRLCVLDDRMKVKYTVKEIRNEINRDFFFPDVLTSYTLKDGLFYIAESMSGIYKLYVADERGKEKYVIEKRSEKIPYNDYEREQLNEFLTASKFHKLDSSKVYYKKAVNSIEIDKRNRIWTQPSLVRTEANQDSFYIDVFEGGKFINRTVLDFVKGNEIYKLKGNRLYVIPEGRKSVRVYDYE
jgi:hypothetical protein